jgi:adenylyltransferase/sulfurtransferase
MPVNERYSRQILLKNIQEDGQKILSKSKVAIIGCGALGTTIADSLVRSGVGHIRLIDRDIIELNNLQRQNLFNEHDVGLPKAYVAAENLKEANSEIKIEYIIDDVNHKNIVKFIKDVDVVLDGTDNMLIRFLINDACVKHNIPWVYGGAIETYGMTMNIIPQKTPCFRCIIHDLPATGLLPTCDTVGVLNSIPNIIASIQSTETIKIILKKNVNNDLLIYDIWSHDFQKIKIKKKNDCICCTQHEYEFLNAIKSENMISLCGKGAIQITPAKMMELSFEDLAQKLQKVGDVENREVILRFNIPNYELNIFRNGRTIIIGTNDKKIAKSLYSKYVGL